MLDIYYPAVEIKVTIVFYLFSLNKIAFIMLEACYRGIEFKIL